MNSGAVGPGDKVYLGERKTAVRVLSVTHLRGERAVKLGRAKDLAAWRRWVVLGRPKDSRPAVVVLATVPIADLVRDIPRRGWRQRWQQTEAFPDAVTTAGVRRTRGE